MPENPTQATSESDVSKKETVEEDKSTTITEDSLFERSKELGDVFTDEEVELLEKLRKGNTPKKLEEMDKIVSGIEDRERNKNKGDQTNQDSLLVESNPDPDAESVLDSSSENSGEKETLIEEKAEDTVIEKNPVNPIIIMNELSSKRKSIEAKISKGVSKEEEKELRQEIKEISREFIKQGYNVLRDSRDVDREIEEKETDEWRKSIEAIFGKNGDAEEKYQAREREIVETIALNKEMGKVMDEKWTHLPDAIKESYGNNKEQFKQNYFESTRNEVFRRTADHEGKDGILLSKSAFCGLIRQGFSPEDIRPANYWQVIKHSIGRLAVFDTFVSLAKGPFVSISEEKSNGKEKIIGWAEFKKFVDETEKNFKKEVIEKAGDLGRQAEERSEKRKKATVEQYVLDIKVREISEAIKAKQEKEKAERAEQKNKEKIEKAEKLEPGERLKLINSLRRELRDAKKIDKALKDGKIIKAKDKEGNQVSLDPSNKKERRDLFMAKGILSEKIIELANKLTGENLKQKAREETGYVFDKENLDKEKQRDFREWLTKRVAEIIDEQIKKIEEQTGEKVRAKKKVKK